MISFYKRCQNLVFQSNEDIIIDNIYGYIKYGILKKNLPTNLIKCHIKRQSNVHIVISVSLDPCHLLAFNRKCICMYVSTSGTFSCKNNTTTNKVPHVKT